MPCPYKHGHCVQFPTSHSRKDDFFRSAHLLQVLTKILCMTLNPRVSSACESSNFSPREVFYICVRHNNLVNVSELITNIQL